MAHIALAGVFAMAIGGCDGQAVPAARAQSAPPASATDSGRLATATLNSAPTFENQGAWSEGYRLARGKGPGVVVGPGTGNPNVFAQAFPATAGDRFTVVARASSGAGPKSRARIQVNWTAADGRFLAVSSRAFEVGADESRVEETVIAPADVARGTLYVVGDGAESVVRYTEMRLLGKPAAADTMATTAATNSAASGGPEPVASAVPRPSGMPLLQHNGRALTPAESQYYFYQAAHTLQRRAKERGMDFIMYVMPDDNIARLMPAIEQLRREGIKVLAYKPQPAWPAGVDTQWFWQQADSHWSEAAVRLTADEILRMWKTGATENRPFSRELMDQYTGGFRTAAE